MTTFHVKVKPDQDTFTIDTTGTYPRITLTQPAEQGRANTELTSTLSTILETDVHIVSGHKSRRKKLSADIDEDTLTARLAAYSVE